MLMIKNKIAYKRTASNDDRIIKSRIHPVFAGETHPRIRRGLLMLLHVQVGGCARRHYDFPSI